MITVNKAKAEQVLDRLYAAYQSKEYPFNQTEAAPPQVKENLPESLAWGSRQHALFLFTLCYWMRGGIKSHTATRQLTRLYNEDPAIFLPETWSSIDSLKLVRQLAGVGLGFNAEQTSGIWRSNFARLHSDWGSDPRNLFVGITTYDEACGRIQNRGRTGFRGFQEKMVSMITYFYMHAGMIDRWNFPIPVDFHVLRTMFAHEIIVATEDEANGNGFYTKPILATVRKLFLEYGADHKVDPIELCDAVWLYSGLMCNQHPGNQSLNGSSKVRYGRKTEVRPVPRWTESQQRAFERTCAVCVVQATCQWCVPAADYYIRGRIELRERRETPPQGSFFPTISLSRQNK